MEYYERLVWRLDTLFSRLDRARERGYDRISAFNRYCVGFSWSDRAYGPMSELLGNYDMAVYDNKILAVMLPEECCPYTIDSRVTYQDDRYSVVIGDPVDILVAMRRNNDNSADMLIWWNEGEARSFWEQDDQGVFRLMGQGIQVYGLEYLDLV